MSYKYVGGGYFRDMSVPVGKSADLVHAPEMVEEFNKSLIYLDKYLAQIRLTDSARAHIAQMLAKWG